MTAANPAGKPIDDTRGVARYEALDSLRGIAALAVALHHFQAASHIYSWPVTRNAYLFVEFFFVLSGFVIAHAYHARLGDFVQVRKFMIKRVARVWPLHLVMLAVFVASETLLYLASHKMALPLPRPPFSENRTLAGIPLNFFLLNGIVPYVGAEWNGPSWSVSVELVSYAAFAVTALAGDRIARNSQLAIMVLAAAVLLFADAPPWIARCLYSFFLGTWLWRWRHHADRVSATPFEAAALIVAMLILTSGNFWGRYVLCSLAFAAVILAVATERGWLSRILRHRFLRMLGTLSYSIYMVHFFIAFALTNVIKLAGKMFHFQSILPGTDLATIGGSYWLMDVVTLCYLIAIVAIARFTYAYVEQPGMKLGAAIAARIGRRKGSEPAAAQP